MSTLLIALMAGCAPTIAIIVNYYLSKRDIKKSNIAVEVNSNKLDDIHFLVNGRLDEALKRIIELEKALGINPDSPSPPPLRRDNYE